MHRSTIPLTTSRSMANAAASTTRQSNGYPSIGNCRGSPQTHQYDRTRSSPERRQSKEDDDDEEGEKSSGRCTPVPKGAGPEPFEYPSNPERSPVLKTTVTFERMGSATYRVLTPRNGSPLPIPSGAAFGGRIVRPSSARGHAGAKPHRFVIVANPPPIPPSLIARRREDQRSHKTCAKIVVTPPSPVRRTAAIRNGAS